MMIGNEINNGGVNYIKNKKIGRPKCNCKFFKFACYPDYIIG